jgi:hypothetical protein
MYRLVEVERKGRLPLVCMHTPSMSETGREATDPVQSSWDHSVVVTNPLDRWSVRSQLVVRTGPNPILVEGDIRQFETGGHSFLLVKGVPITSTGLCPPPLVQCR